MYEGSAEVMDESRSGNGEGVELFGKRPSFQGTRQIIIHVDMDSFYA